MISPLAKIKRIILFLGDVSILYFSLWLTLLVRYQKIVSAPVWNKHWLPFTLVFGLWIIIFFINKLYELETAKNSFQFYSLLGKSMLWCALIGFVFFYVATTGISPKTILILDLLIFSGLFFIWRRFYNQLVVHKKFLEEALMIGLTAETINLAQEINSQPQKGIRVKTLVRLDNNQAPLTVDPFFEVLDETVNLQNLIIKNKIRLVIVANNLNEHQKLINHLYQSLAQKITIFDLPKFAEEFTGKILVNTIGQLWFLENIKEGNKKAYETTKRLTDIVLSLGLLLLTMPFLPLIYGLIRLGSPGPGFFQQQRTGRNGKKFMAVKFRTMSVDAEKNGPQWAQKNDPRVTPVGRFMRKSRIDEIPQLVNILRGEMSFIGPRPERPEFIEKLKTTIPFYETRLLIKPGLTGWAQINFPYGASEADALEKLQYDLYYIKNRSLTLDWSIILKTIKTVLSGGGQ
ncbi:sugar transferase [Candidatus Kuenenbacteria bacterium]|nr:sugar transferase [Candidatus Kuenenbacteria bacterium]